MAQGPRVPNRSPIPKTHSHTVTCSHSFKFPQSHTLTYPHTFSHTLKFSVTHPHTSPWSHSLTPSNAHALSHIHTHSHVHSHPQILTVTSLTLSHILTCLHTHTHTHTLTCALLTPAVSRPLPSAKATLRLCKCHQLCCLGPGRPGTLGSEGCCGLVPGPLAPHKLKDAQNPSALGLRRFRGRATLLKPEPLNPSTPRASRARQSWERPEEGPALGLG